MTLEEIDEKSVSREHTTFRFRVVIIAMDGPAEEVYKMSVSSVPQIMLNSALFLPTYSSQMVTLRLP